MISSSLSRAMLACAVVSFTMIVPPVSPRAMAAREAIDKGYSAVDLQPLNAGGGTNAYAVNGRGVVVGDSDGRPARWGRDGRAVELSLPEGFTGGYASGINDLGVISGYVNRGDVSPYFPARWDIAGHARALALPLGTIGGGAGPVSKRGSIMGNALTADFRSRAVRWDPRGQLVELETPVGGESQAIAMNDFDEVVGWATGQGAVRWNAQGKLAKLPPPDSSAAYSVNNRGAVLGNGVVYHKDGRIALLSRDLGFSTSYGSKINDRNVVMAWGTVPGGHLRCARWDMEGQGKLLNLLPLDTDSWCFDLNNSGMTVGESFPNSGGSFGAQPVYWNSDGVAFALPSPATLRGIVAQHINPSGDVIVGYGFDESNLTYRAIMWRRS